jgi:hypothetical protein
MNRCTYLIAVVVLATLGAKVSADDIYTEPGVGNFTWPDPSGLTGGKDPKSKGALVTVITTTDVMAGHTAVVKYQIGTFVNNQFQEIANYSRNLQAGNGQQVSNSFAGLAFNVEYTVYVTGTFDNNGLLSQTFSRKITVKQ